MLTAKHVSLYKYISAKGKYLLRGIERENVSLAGIKLFRSVTSAFLKAPWFKATLGIIAA